MIVEFYYIPWRTSWEYCLEISDLRFINSWYICQLPITQLCYWFGFPKVT